jgi:protein gp37
MGAVKYRGLTRKSRKRAVWTGKIRLDHSSLDTPRKWSKPRKVFVNSMSDLFHDDVPVEFIARIWNVMRDTPRHTYQILTKRPERMAQVLAQQPFQILRNVWLGTSIEDGRVLSRLDAIRRVPAAIRFVSLEPLIGSVAAGDLTGIHWAIVGGESGPRAREMKPEWVDEIETMCRSSGTAFFFKQWGGKNKKAAGRELNGRTYDEMPTLSM